MSVPAVRAPELDGALGITPPSSGLPQVIIGQCVAGPFNTPAAFARPKDIISTFTAGRAAEAAAYACERFQKPVIVVRTEADTAHGYSAVDDTGQSGTSAITVDGALAPNDDYQVRVIFPTAGTIGSSGITLQWSLDDGRTYSPVAALGTANAFTITDGNVKLEFAAGTIVAGDAISFTATAATWDADNLDDALESVYNAALLWEFGQVCGALTSASADVISAWLDSLAAVGKLRHAFGGFRIPNAGETEAQYLAAFVAAFGSFGDTRMHICAGAAKVSSSIARRRYRRPAAHPVAAMLSSVSEEVDIAALDYRLPGVELRDAYGNPEAGYHDESINPGLDDVRALVLRTWDGETGVFVNNPRLISPVGSDFDFSPKRRVMNLAREYVIRFFRRRVLSKPLRINPKTGFVRESELLALEAECNQGLRRLIMAKPKASSVRVVLSRTDAITNPPYPLTGQLRLIPLAYPKDITIESGWALTEDFEIAGVATT
jgi:hypothetical protein